MTAAEQAGAGAAIDGQDVWIGIDLGTQSVRVLAVAGDGAVLGAASRSLASRRDGGRHEQDPQQWWDAVCAASREAMQHVPAQAVRGLAVDATSGTVLLTDADGAPLTPALMYDDGRAAEQTPRVNEVGAAVWDALGYRRMQPSWALPKLLWLLQQQPELAGRARLAHQNDVINRRLVGHPVSTDLSNALKTGAQLIDECWPQEVFDQLGVPAPLLPDLVRPGTPIGTVSAQAAQATGIPAGTTVVSGSTDGCASQLGSGALSVGSWNSVLGTTLILKGVTRDLIHDPLGAVYSHKAPDGTWLPGGASSTGAGVISRDFPGADLDALNRAARAHEPATVLTYPLVSNGERFPFVAPDARGFTSGTPVGDGDRFAAILQGVAFIERLCFDYLDLLGAPTDGALVLTGGATRSSYWNQLRADVLDHPVTLPENAEPALGMAVLAASTDRSITDVAADMVRVRTVLEPGPGAGDRYTANYLALITELEQRGWLPTNVARHAEQRSTR